MEHVVAKPFNTVNRRFREGDPVLATEDLSPHSFDDLKARRWIVSEGTKTGAAAVKVGNKIAAAEEESQLAAQQDDLRRVWEAGLAAGVEPTGEWAVLLEDDDLFGTVIQEEGKTVFIQVPGEEGPRCYRGDQVDRAGRSAKGKWTESSTATPRKR